MSIEKVISEMYDHTLDGETASEYTKNLLDFFELLQTISTQEDKPKGDFESQESN